MFIEDYLEDQDVTGFDINLLKNDVVAAVIRVKFDQEDIEKPEFIGRNPDGSMKIMGDMIMIKGKHL